MKIKSILFILIIFITLLTGCIPKSNLTEEQIKIKRLEEMTSIQEPYKMRDWKEVAIKYDKLVFDLNKKGEFFPLIWIDDSKRNYDIDSFGIYSFIGDTCQSGEKYEGIVAMGSVFGASLSGIDKSNQEYDYVEMCINFMNLANGRKVISNATQAGDGSFWYSIFPSIPFYGLMDLYPEKEKLEEVAKINSDRWYQAVEILGGENADFFYSYFDFVKMKPIDNQIWYEPDSAAGVAWIQYMSYAKWGDEKYLNASKWSMNFLEELEPIENPFYEVLLPYGVYISARLNAEQDCNYDTEKYVNWLFDGLSIRPAWSVVFGKWGEYDINGLQGSLTDKGGYAFAMNTFSMAMPMVPMVRYDNSYAEVVGKWMLGAANSARLFYPDEIDDEKQSCSDYMEIAENVVAYEGLAKKWGMNEPYAMGDARKYGWAATDFGLYGSSYVGIFGGLIETTNIEQILKLDCLKTDFFGSEAYPTYLYFNPYDESKFVEVDLGESFVDLYDAVSNNFLLKGVSGKVEFEIKDQSAIILTLIPEKANYKKIQNRLTANDIIIDYSY